MRTLWKSPWLRLVLVLVAGTLGWWLYEEQVEHRYDAQILRAAQRYGVDPALVKAVVWRESGFDAAARGRAGELGLMQIRNAAAFEWATAERRTNQYDHAQLVDPGTNTLAGAWYLSKLLRRYRDTDDPLPYALADYNAGRTHALRWMKGDGRTNSAVFLSQMDYAGTRRYIDSIRERYSHYQGTFTSEIAGAP